MTPKINPSPKSSPVNSFFDSHAIVRPKRDWIIIGTLFIAMIFFVMIFDAYMYTQIVNGDMYVSVNQNELTLENLKTAQLQAVINTFEARKEKVANMKVEKLVDPSI